MIKVLSTKQLEEKDLAYARSLNFDVTCKEFIEVIPVLWNESVLKDFVCDSVAFTSSSGVKYFLCHPAAQEWIKGKNVFAIAGKTFEALDALGVPVVAVADDSEALTDGVIDKNVTQCILHVCGNIRLDTLEKKLARSVIKYYPFEVYETKLITGLQLNGDFDVILFFSPSGVDGFLSANQISDKTICCCIGNTTASHLKQLAPSAKIVISPFPSPRMMLERVATFFDRTSY